ncbi:MAG: M56 family metallopeptidase [Pseudomonadota bacterium]|nr:M56 family metallopeptidase [Pseudomonadota bacterium]
MIELLINFSGTTLVYCALAVSLLWSAQRLGWLRDGAVAEFAWRSALWLGILVAAVSALRAPVTDLWASTGPRAVSEKSIPIAQRALSSSATATTPRVTAARLADRPDVAISVSESSTAGLTHMDVDSARWLSLLFGVALMLAVWRLLRSIWSSRRMLRQARRRSRPAHPQWLLHRDQLAQNTGDVRILTVAELDSPIAAHTQLILLPEWCDALPSDAQRALLAHELAHIERRDPRWRLLDAVAVALMAGFPFARYAQLRLHDLSEFACDAAAARRSGAPRALAECLAHCLEHALNQTPALAVAMATPARGIVARVHRLLEETPMFWNNWSRRSRQLVIAAAVAMVLVLPGIAVTVAREQGEKNTSISIKSNMSLFGGDSTTASYSDGARKLKVKLEGKVQFNDTETAVTSISEGGQLSIVEERDGVRRELRLQPEGKAFARLYRVDGDEVPYDAAAQRWFSAVLPDIFRVTGFDADARLKRILARGGVDAVLLEIAQLHSDYVRSSYVGGLFANSQLDSPQLERVIVLIESIKSDYELRRALTPALATGTLTDSAQARVLGLAARMESDYERAELLISASKRIALNGARLPAWESATKDIGSDYEKRRVLEALLAQKAQYPEHAELAIAMAASIGSDYEKRMLLEAAANLEVLDSADYVRVARTIDSDYERREALMLLLGKGPVSKEIALAVIEAAGDIGSDYEAKEVLLALAKVMPSDPQVIEEYRSVTRSMSPYERGEAEAGLDRFFASA